MESGKRNYELDFWKFVFTFVILLFHSHKLVCTDGNPNLLIKGYVGVEFFFMVSGYLMMSGIMRNDKTGKESTVWQFILKKIKALFPGILFAFVLNFVVWNAFCEPKDLKNSVIALLYALPELMFIRYSGIRFGTHFYNGPTWYISAMILGMFVLYPVAKRYKEKFGMYLAPIISIAFYAWATHGTKNLSLTHEWLDYINGGFARAIAGLCIGAFLYFASEYFKSSYQKINKLGNVLLVFAEIAVCIALFIFMRSPKIYERSNDVIAIVYIVLLLLIILSRDYDTSKFFGTKPMKFLYKLSLPLFLNQRVIIYYLEAVQPDLSFKKAMAIYFGVTIVLALISIPVTKMIELTSKKIQNLITTDKEA